MKSFIKILSTTLIFNFINANDVQPALTEEQQNELMSQVMQLVWEQVVIAKEATSAAVPHIREELLENLLYGHISKVPNFKVLNLMVES